MKISSVYQNNSLNDKYTVIFNSGDALALSENPGSKDGFARWILVDEYDENTLGTRIEFTSLPEEVQNYVLTTMNKEKC